jgi:C4-type Zn-finger protein
MEKIKDQCPVCGKADLQYTGSHPVRKHGEKVWIDFFECPKCKHAEEYETTTT